jgi:hypothetical protein
LELNTDNQLVLEFDDLNEFSSDYSYTLIHCSSNWEPSGLNPIEYLNGFETVTVDNYSNSFNTLIPYMHYKITIPDENLKMNLSGNYLLYVYEGFDMEKPVITQRFYVFEKEVEIEAEVVRSSLVSEMDDSQELEISVHDVKNIVLNPIEDLNIAVFQNNSQLFFLKCGIPDFIRANIFEYKNARKLSIKGGNEFRYLNTKNLKYVSEKINAIYFEKPFYRFELIEDSALTDLPYSYSGDINGNFLIISDHNENVDIESEYVLVDFNFRSDFIPAGEIYIYGAISNWGISEGFKTAYDFNKKAYTKQLLLKQGIYNYAYVLFNKEDNTYSLAETEGNSYETENEYLILVYFKPQGATYEKIVGYKLVNTIKRL